MSSVRLMGRVRSPWLSTHTHGEEPEYNVAPMLVTMDVHI